MPDPVSHVLYTYGYRAPGGSVEDLLEHATAGALIIDARYAPYSRWQRQWNRDALRATLGDRYEWWQDLGNVNYKNGGPIRIKDLDFGLQALSLLYGAGRAAVLLCACADPTTCHRSLVAEAARRPIPGLEVVHLAPGDRISQVPTGGQP